MELPSGHTTAVIGVFFPPCSAMVTLPTASHFWAVKTGTTDRREFSTLKLQNATASIASARLRRWSRSRFKADDEARSVPKLKVVAVHQLLRFLNTVLFVLTGDSDRWAGGNLMVFADWVGSIAQHRHLPCKRWERGRVSQPVTPKGSGQWYQTYRYSYMR